MIDCTVGTLGHRKETVAPSRDESSTCLTSILELLYVLINESSKDSSEQSYSKNAAGNRGAAALVNVMQISFVNYIRDELYY